MERHMKSMTDTISQQNTKEFSALGTKMDKLNHRMETMETQMEHMQNQRDELNDAINELKAQLDWGRQLLQQKRCSIE